MAIKKVVKKKFPDENTFIVHESGDLGNYLQASAVEGVEDNLRTMVRDEGGDSFYQNREYYIYKLVKRVRVNIEQPLPVVKLIPVKD